MAAEARVSERVETVIVGGGQAGLATSYHLKQHDREHIVLEREDRPASAWRNGRWDSFTLVSPNWTFKMPGAEYSGDDPDGFMPRTLVIHRFERYIAGFDLPVRLGVTVTAVEPLAENRGYLVTTDAGTIEAENVVVATGLFQRPKVSPVGAKLPATVQQLHSGQYRNPRALPEGAVLVVGTAQSGCQIAQELYQSGRKVYLCVGSAGRIPRRYRGRDIFEWLDPLGFFDRTEADLPSPRAKFAGNPALSGHLRGQTLNVHRFARDGVTLLGHLRGADGDTLHLAPDLKESLAKSDAFESQIIASIDEYIEKAGLDVPAEELPVMRDGYSAEEITELSLQAAGITTVIWATGYDFDFNLVRLPVTDEFGYPIEKRGVTEYPGLYFVGLPWLYKMKSGLLLGVGEDAEFIAGEIAGRAPGNPANVQTS
jgi:putative flavoprotein involved in K+ transport